MADTKISALTAATTPLAGTEVLPIVQSGTTVKVTNNDLRPKQIQSNATSGVLQVVGPAAAQTRVMTVPDANFTAARTDAGQTFKSTQIINDAAGTNYLAKFQNTSATGNVTGIDISLESTGNSTNSWHLRGVTQDINAWYLYGNGTTSYSSDERLKKNIETTREGYLGDLMNLRVVKYNWHNDKSETPKELGLIAQEVEKVFPGLIQEHELDGVGMRKNIKHSVMEFILIKSIQELKKEFDEYKAAHP